MYGKSKAILLQVAFKEAAGDIDQTRKNYQSLLTLIDEFGIDPDEVAPRSSGGNRGGSRGSAGGGSTQPRPTPPTFIHDDSLWSDYRALKASGAVKPNFPDFKNEQTDEAVWLLDRDGAPTPKGEVLVAAADTKVF